VNRLLVPLVSLVFVALAAVSPWFVVTRAFGGKGVLLAPFGLVNPGGMRVPEVALSWVQPAFWAWVALAVLASLAYVFLKGKARVQALYLLGGLGLLLFALEAFAFYRQVAEVNAAALEAGARRPPLKRYSLSLGLYLQLFYALFLLVLAKIHTPGGAGLLVRYRGVVVPAVSLILAMVAGGVLVWLLRPVPGLREPLSTYEYIVAKLDLVTYTFQLLFGPVLTLPGLFQSALIATPLIFTGLSVAFGFKAGLFNIGAPGQLIMGAVFAMFAGLYLPGPKFLVLPAAIAAAALGGALWGAIPGWLKARFGAHEVINTIMMNYIALSVMLLLLSKNEWSFFTWSTSPSRRRATSPKASRSTRPPASPFS